MKLSILYIIISFLFIRSCSELKLEKEEIIVSIGDKKLLKSELDSIVPQSMKGADSMYFAQAFVQRWIKRQLLVKAAEKNLENPQDLKEKIENYRQELLIYQYKQQMMEQKFNHHVDEKEIMALYQQTPNKFILSNTIVRAGYFVFDVENRPDSRIKQLMISPDTYDINELEEITYRMAKRSENFGNNWILLSTLENMLEIDLEKNENILKKNKIFEQEIGNDLHVIAIKEVMFSGELAPIEYVENQIREIIINKRKLSFLNEIQDSLYEEALKYNNFRVFN